jgi:transcriptional regulator with XRE-family HTH domain
MGAQSFGKSLGELVLQKRKSVGLTQTQLAEDAFGTSAKTRRISELENGTVANPHPKTIDPIIVALKISEAELEECAKNARVVEDTDLDRAYREARNLIDAIARQFEHSKPDASLAEVDDYLRSKAREWSALRKRIDNIDAVESMVVGIKIAADEALSEGDFEQVDTLLAKLEEEYQQQLTLAQVAKQAEIRISRGDVCLLREAPEQALECYLSAAKFFQPFDESRMVELLSITAHRLYESSQRSIRPRFFVSARLLEVMIELDSVKGAPLPFAGANYQLGLIFRNEATKNHKGYDKELLEKAIHHARVAAESSAHVGESYHLACAQSSLANCLLDRARFENDRYALQESIATFRDAKTSAQDTKETNFLLGQICNSLGAALNTLSKFLNQDEADVTSDEALGEFLQAIKISELHHDLEVWGAAKFNIAGTLRQKAQHKDVTSAARSAFNIRAISEYQAALETFPATAFPDRFADAQYELGGVLFNHAVLLNNPLSELYFARAIAAYQSASSVFSRDFRPERWAFIQLYVGEIFALHANSPDVTSSEYDLKNALGCFQAALEVFEEIGNMVEAQMCKNAISRAKKDLQLIKTAA